ncbi:MAG: pentapeptide repeat-containing protein [Nostoc sp.]
MGHRVLITGRSMSLQGIPYLPRNLERVEIVEMDGQLQQKWLDKWEELPANKGKTAAFGQFLQSDKCPSEVKNLAPSKTTQLFRIINYSNCIQLQTFNSVVGQFLSGANLSGAALFGANLFGADLGGANLSDKDWGDIGWDENTKWDEVKGLDTARNVPEALKQQLGLS